MDISYSAPLTERSYLATGSPVRTSYYGFNGGAGPTLSLRRLVADEDDVPGCKWFSEYVRPCVAELFAMMLLVIVGTISLVTGEVTTIATVHGLAISLLVASFGPISGGHINPAVTIGVCLGGGLGPIKAILYIVSQLIGAMAGAGIVRGALSYIPVVNNPMNITQFGLIAGGAHTIPAGVPVGMAIIAEVGFTTVLVMTVLMTAVNTDGKNAIHPLVIGFAVLIGILASMNISGASLNPALSFGRTVLMKGVKTANDANLWDKHWVYWVGPIGGAVVAATFYKIIFARPDKRLIFNED